jgi:hypothetical protein
MCPLRFATVKFLRSAFSLASSHPGLKFHAQVEKSKQSTYFYNQVCDCKLGYVLYCISRYKISSLGTNFIPCSKIPYLETNFIPGTKIPFQGTNFAPGSKIPYPGKNYTPRGKILYLGANFLPGCENFVREVDLCCPLPLFRSLTIFR